MFKNWLKSIAVVFIFCAVLSILSIIETTYTRKAIVIKVKNNIVTVEDESGNLWQFLADDFEKGESVKLIMDDHHTLAIEDDIIKDFKRIN